MTAKIPPEIESERLILREFHDEDDAALNKIMQKPEVMYAWGHGFSLAQTQDWIARQKLRCRDDGFGYMAAILKETGTLIGQAGLLRSMIKGESITEVAYIFDNAYWGNGYATEAASALVQTASKIREIGKLYCTIRPENTASIKVAKRLGFVHIGNCTKVYESRNILHEIYRQQ